tara:strand:- start:3166 stop:4224 length:1059 start_codon:yes stop_codon:yes gene_type:complete
MEIESIKLLTYSRFDIIPKIMYTKSRIKSIDSDYFLNVYKSVIWRTSSFSREKHDFKQYITSFNLLIDSMNKSGFDKSISKVPFITLTYNSDLIKDHIHICNGVHRTGVSIAMGNKVYLEKVNMISVELSSYINWRNQVPKKILSHMAIEYSKLKTNTCLIVTYYEKIKDEDLFHNIIHEYGHVVYGNYTELNKTGTLNLIKELGLSNECDLKSFNNSGYFGIRKVYLIETEHIQELKEEIKEIKTTFITTNHKITVDASKLVFNDNSVDRLNNKISNNTDEIDIILDKFKEDIEETNKDLDDYCIVGSLPKFLLEQSKEFKMEFVYLKTGYDDIIYDPKNHFYYKGIKFNI